MNWKTHENLVGNKISKPYVLKSYIKKTKTTLTATYMHSNIQFSYIITHELWTTNMWL